MKKKGFTLIELLAVIIILAVIALIAIPVITNIINKARKSAAIDSAYAVLEAGRLYYTNYLLEHSNDAFADTEIVFDANGVTIIEDSEELDSDDSKYALFSLKGTKPDNGSISISADGEVTVGIPLRISGYNLTQSGDEIVEASGVLDLLEP